MEYENTPAAEPGVDTAALPHPQLIDGTLLRIRAWAIHSELNRRLYALAVGFPDTTLRDFWRPEWHPSVPTLRRLESIIPLDWVPSADELARAQIKTGGENGSALAGTSVDENET